MTVTLSRGAKVNADIAALLRARNTLLWIATREEKRVENALQEAAASVNYKVLFWDCVRGQTGANGIVQDDRTSDPLAMLRKFDTDTALAKTVLIMRDLHKWFDPPTLRALRNLARSFQSDTKTIVLLGPSSEVPPELAGHATVIDYPLPDRQEVAAILGDILAGREAIGKPVAIGDKEACIDAAVGLSAEEISNCYAKSLVLTKTIDPKVVSQEKKQVIAREKVLTWIDPDPRGLAAIGGLDVLKDWLIQRKCSFTKEAKAYGLPSPKGILLVGPPGTGKSLTAKCVATAFAMPLLRLDMGALKSKWVGESEANIRKALATAEAVAPCVVWLDEIEKALGGGASGAADGGVSADALGSILSWMQERQGSVFVVATANDVASLPPELLRKGRFDELWFVDLPTFDERCKIVNAVLTPFGASIGDVEPMQIAEVTDGFTGAELAAIVPDAMFQAFADGGRQVTTDDLIAAALKVIPLAKTAADKIDGLRKWAKGKCRMANAAEVVETPAVGRRLDLDDN